MALDFSFNKEEVKQKIFNAKRACIITHKNPDGDAIGSSLGLAGVLSQLNIDTKVLVPNKHPEFLQWIPFNEKILVWEKETESGKNLIQNADLIFFLDFSNLSRIEELEQDVLQSKAYKIHIDHHPNAESPSDILLNYTNVSSTAELTYWFLRELELDKHIKTDEATALYVGICTDTGSFNHNARNNTFLTVAFLLDRGINKNEIHSRVFDNFSFDRMRLLGYCLENKMEYIPEYNTAFISITKEELARFNFVLGDTEGFVNYPLSIKGVRFSAIFIENPDLIKISLRSKGSMAVNKVSEKYFNGGGHINAAGGNSTKSMEETLNTFRNLLVNYKDELQN
jgi:phosphoesterase RecJ-like protein